MVATTHADFNRMSVQERLALIEAIWKSIEADGGAVPLTAAQSNVLRQREADAKRNPDAETDSAAVDKAVRQRLSKRAGT